ncbi:MAG: transglycosylase domain-containing protein, partial [Actinomycetaceae bacterium]
MATENSGTPRRPRASSPASGGARGKARASSSGEGGTRTKAPKTDRVPVYRRILFWAAGLFIAGLAAVAGLFVAAYASISVPEPDDFALAEGTTIYYADGSTTMGRFAEFDRT